MGICLGRELRKIGRELRKIGRELRKIGREITIFSREITNNREGIESAGEKEKRGGSTSGKFRRYINRDEGRQGRILTTPANSVILSAQWEAVLPSCAFPCFGATVNLRVGALKQGMPNGLYYVIHHDCSGGGRNHSALKGLNVATCVA